MEIKKRHTTLQQAFATLKESINLLENPQAELFKTQMQDSVIQRFEYTIDLFWKFLRRYMEHKYTVTFDFIAPREILKQGLHYQVITEQEHSLLTHMLSDRNQTSHTYNEKLASEIVAHIVQHHKKLEALIARLQ